MRISRLIAGAAALLALVPAAATAAEQQTPVRAPKSGVYAGSTSQHRKFSLQVSGKTVSLVLFRFPCAGAQAAASLQDIALKKGATGYHFTIFAYSSIQYTDDESENAPIRMRGSFTRSGKRVGGRVRVTTDRCGVTRFRWWAKRTAAG